MKRKPNEEIFEDGDKVYTLAADFGFLVAVANYGRDPSDIFTDLANGLTPPEDVRNVLISCFKDVDDSKKEFLAEDLINRYGLQECSIMARVMLSHAMIGDIKKLAIDRDQTLKSLTDLIEGSRLTSLCKLGLLSAGITIISTMLVCGIFKFFGPLIL